jgi:hypothetical protein
MTVSLSALAMFKQIRFFLVAPGFWTQSGQTTSTTAIVGPMVSLTHDRSSVPFIDPRCLRSKSKLTCSFFRASCSPATLPRPTTHDGRSVKHPQLLERLGVCSGPMSGPFSMCRLFPGHTETGCKASPVPVECYYFCASFDSCTT